jgi:hypothetical protein
MARSTAVVPVVLDNRVQHLGKLYVNNLRAAHRMPPLGTSDTVYSNHYTSVCSIPSSKVQTTTEKKERKKKNRIFKKSDNRRIFTPPYRASSKRTP